MVFSFFDMFLILHRFLILMKSAYRFSLPRIVPSILLFKKLPPDPSHLGLLLLSAGNSVVLHCTPRPLIHLGLISVGGRSVFTSSCASTILKRQSLLLFQLYPFVKDELTVSMGGPLWTLYSVPFIICLLFFQSHTVL